MYLTNFSQEEEDWLDALEAGELDDFGRLKQEKDTSMMTARQVGLNSLIIKFLVRLHGEYNNTCLALWKHHVI